VSPSAIRIVAVSVAIADDLEGRLRHVMKLDCIDRPQRMQEGRRINRANIAERCATREDDDDTSSSDYETVIRR
jgi:hypothetical protein